MPESCPDVPCVQVSVRELAEFFRRSGGLAASSLSRPLTGAEGIRIHQRTFRLLEQEARESSGRLETEVTLATDVMTPGMTLRIGGRIDALLTAPDRIRLIEVKTLAAALDHVPDGGDEVHWAQAMLYAHLLGIRRESREPGSPLFELELLYVQADTGDRLGLVRTPSPQEIKSFFDQCTAAYIEWATILERHRSARNRSLQSLRFPYPVLRPGQKRLMEEVVGTIRQRSTLIVQAPTGTGKTMAVLFPALKALGRDLCDHVFYLTAKTAARSVAEKAMGELAEAGLIARWITLTAKEKICPRPDLFCDPEHCPLATHYYDRIRPAVHDLLLHAAVARDLVLETALRHGVCPFELSLDASVHCDVVIADYNYAFDPRVRLERFFGIDSSRRNVLLVDEAHNLPDRSKEMVSAVLEREALRKARGAVKGLERELDRTLDAALACLDSFLSEPAGEGEPTDLAPSLARMEPECSPNSEMRTSGFHAARVAPRRLAGKLRRFTIACRPVLERMPPGARRRDLADTYFDVLFFLRVHDEFFNETYVTTVSFQPETGSGLAVCLRCLDASTWLRSTYHERYPAVFFSATLSPIEYFSTMICREDPGGGGAERLLLASPFPPENLFVGTVPSLSIRYRDRAATLAGVADVLVEALAARRGNYLLFFPSFAYLRACLGEMRRIARDRGLGKEIEWHVQDTAMSDSLRESYLARFNCFGGATLAACAVLGGVFAEGIDLVGECLSGVMIVGVGLPQVCPEREILRDYFQMVRGAGFDFAYRFPGFNKVTQAAGRVIRSETDRGFILLIDERYDLPDYRSLFPEDWRPQSLSSGSEVREALASFLGEAPPPNDWKDSRSDSRS